MLSLEEASVLAELESQGKEFAHSGSQITGLGGGYLAALGHACEPVSVPSVALVGPLLSLSWSHPWVSSVPLRPLWEASSPGDSVGAQHGSGWGQQQARKGSRVGMAQDGGPGHVT